MLLPPQPIQEWQKVSFAYQHKGACIHHINWALYPAERYAIIGRSGCGKSTLLQLAKGLLQPTQGSIQTSEPGHLEYVFQIPVLLEWLSALDNVLLPNKLHKTLKPEHRTRARQLFIEASLIGLEDRHPQFLSQGQRCRVALIRALLSNPDFLLLDEPFASLDTLTKFELYELFLDHCHRLKLGLLLVTHDLREAILFADKIWIMQDGRLIDHLMVPLAWPRRVDLFLNDEFLVLEHTLMTKLQLQSDSS
ncbi:MAG: ATP-binding cassette domain-containing protein [Gammaproteobacteria bacterium]|nr:ATP-binding cassette domain-containing protein [Gammaproteobacteria bacterium]